MRSTVHVAHNSARPWDNFVGRSCRGNLLNSAEVGSVFVNDNLTNEMATLIETREAKWRLTVNGKASVSVTLYFSAAVWSRFNFSAGSFAKHARVALMSDIYPDFVFRINIHVSDFASAFITYFLFAAIILHLSLFLRHEYGRGFRARGGSPLSFLSRGYRGCWFRLSLTSVSSMNRFQISGCFSAATRDHRRSV